MEIREVVINAELEKKELIYIVIVVAIGFAIPIFYFPELPFYSEPFIDLFAYTFNILNYAEPKFDMVWYFDDRITALLPSVLLYKLFDFEVARWVNFIFYYILLSFSLLKALTSIFNKKISLLFFSLYIANPIVMGNLSHDYTAIKAEIFLYLSVYFISKYYKKSESIIDITWGGFFFACSIIANMKIILYGSFIFIFPFYYLKNWRQLIKESIYFIGSFLLAFPIFGVVNSLLFNGDFWFYRDSINNLNADIKYGEDDFSYLDTYHAGFNPASFLSFIALFSFGLSLKIDLKKASFAFVPIFCLLLYHIMGGSIFLHTSIGWYFLPFFLCLWPISEKFDLKKLKIEYIFIIFTAVCLIQYNTFDIRGKFAYYWPYYFCYIVLFSIPSLYIVFKREMNNLFIAWLVILFLIIKPFGFARYTFDTVYYQKPRLLQMYKGYIRLKNEFGIDNIQFFIGDKDSEHSIFCGIAFLTVGVSTHKVTNYDKIPYKLNKYIVISNEDIKKRNKLMKTLAEKGYKFHRRFINSVILINENVND